MKLTKWVQILNEHVCNTLYANTFAKDMSISSSPCYGRLVSSALVLYTAAVSWQTRNTCIQKYNLIFLFCDVDTCVEQKCNQKEFIHMEELSGVWTAEGTAPVQNSRTYIVFKLSCDPQARLLSIGYGYAHSPLPCLPLATVHTHALSVFHWLLFYAHLLHVFW